jgi:flagellar hook-length control protein FliK
MAGVVALAAGPVSDPALPAASPGAAAVAEAFLAATPGQSGFAPQLGAQLTLFAREGVQFARLQLNPAELGPVWVQIQLEGQAAQVHLAAENAFTREQLGDALPALAGSLREAGLTLNGGGVFDQPRQHEAFGDPDRGAAAASARGGAAPGASEAHDAAPGALQMPPRRRGIVDLIA